MTRRQRTPWYRPTLPAIEWTAALICEVDASFVPTMLRDLEARKTPALWESEAAWITGYEVVCLQQEALLMSAKNELKNEIRAIANRGDTPPEARDPDLDPYDLPLASLLGINLALADDGGSVLDELRAIRAAVEAESGEEVISRLDTLILLLGA